MRKLFTIFLTLLIISNLGLSFPAAAQPTALPPTEEALQLDPKVEAMLRWALEIAADDSHGYSQRERFGPDYDCTSFVCTALMEGGFALEDYSSTQGLLEQLPALGFAVYEKDDMEPQLGDILVEPGEHVEICMGGLACVGAHQDYDGRSGDSGGHEIEYRPGEVGDSGCPFCMRQQYRYILRYEGLELPRAVPEFELREKQIA